MIFDNDDRRESKRRQRAGLPAFEDEPGWRERWEQERLIEESRTADVTEVERKMERAEAQRNRRHGISNERPRQCEHAEYDNMRVHGVDPMDVLNVEETGADRFLAFQKPDDSRPGIISAALMFALTVKARGKAAVSKYISRQRAEAEAFDRDRERIADGRRIRLAEIIEGIDCEGNPVTVNPAVPKPPKPPSPGIEALKQAIRAEGRDAWLERPIQELARELEEHRRVWCDVCPCRICKLPPDPAPMIQAAVEEREEGRRRRDERMDAHRRFWEGKRHDRALARALVLTRFEMPTRPSRRGEVWPPAEQGPAGHYPEEP